MLDKLAETVKENADAIRDLRQETKEKEFAFLPISKRPNGLLI